MNFTKSITFLYLLLLTYQSSFATNYYVNDTVRTGDVFCSARGASANSGTSKGAPKLTLSSVLITYSVSFASGDTIFVDAGNYLDYDLSSPANGIVIYGASTAKTIFTNPGSDNYFMRIDDNNTTLINMTLKDYDDMGAGIGQVIGVAANKTGVQIIGIQIDHTSQTNTSSNRPIYLDSGSSTFISGGGTTCNNYAGGGGIYITGAATTATITNYSVIGNYRYVDVGVGIYIANGKVLISNSLFQGNISDGTNTGSALYVATGTVNVIDCFFNKNQTTNNSGGANVGGTILIGGGSVRIARSRIWGHAQGGSSTSYGAGIGITAGALTLDSCWIGAASTNSNSGSTTRGTDVYNRGGTINARHCIFGSPSVQIGVATGVASSFSIANCGAPGIYTGSGSALQINNANPTYSANPTVPTFTGTCATSVIILPIELVKFEGECFNGNVQLLWQTASEKDNNEFIIEKSFNGIDFFAIGKLNGAGTSQTMNSYKFIDDAQVEEIQYYRLRQNDYDGKYSQSQIIAVNKSCNDASINSINVYPNPANSDINIELKLYKKETISFSIYDNTGRLIRVENNQTYEAGFITVNIDINNLDQGIYILKATTNNKEFVHKIIKL